MFVEVNVSAVDDKLVAKNRQSGIFFKSNLRFLKDIAIKIH